MKKIFFLLMLAGMLSVPGAEKGPDEKEPAVSVKVTLPADVKYRKGKKIPDLIITANYRSCVILAEIARREKAVPYILLPALGEDKGRIHFIPARKKDIFSVPAKELGKFIAFLAPDRILVLGDELMVPRTFRPLSTPERLCLNIVSGNWKFNAASLGNYLMIEDMDKLYQEACNNNVTDPLNLGLQKR